ncbi:MAG: spore protease YyaC [Syntrophomonadaceae bacterium]
MLSKIANKNAQASFHYEDPGSLSKLQSSVCSLFTSINSDYSRPLVILNIGTDRATGDCLGPLVGTRLHGLSSRMEIYGSLEHPVHATNLEEILEGINKRRDRPIIGAVDACLGNTDRIGYINVRAGSLKPGTALKKSLPEVGDFHISGVVNVGGFFEHLVLQNTRLYIVYKMADLIAKGLYLAFSQLSRYSGIDRPVNMKLD